MKDEDEKPTPCDYVVGYRRPPKHTRFKPGQSGNPRGRKPKSSINDILGGLLAAKREVTIAGKRQFIECGQIMAIRLVEGALAGDLKKIQLVLKLHGQINQPYPFAMSSEDIAEVKRSLREIAAESEDE